MIRLENISAGYDNKAIINNINLSIHPGKITVLIGPNGCGKSTLLKVIVQIIHQQSGNIYVNDQLIESFSSSKLAQHVAYLAQNKNVPDITALRLVLHGRFAYLNYPRKYSKNDLEYARKALKWVGMQDYEDELVSKLSGGMLQKVYIAMAICQNANTILMDEPTTFLDIGYQLRLMKLARELANEGKAVVMVLHDLSQAMQIADHLVVMKDGIIFQQGSVDKILADNVIQQVFGIDLEWVKANNSTHYVCTLK